MRHAFRFALVAALLLAVAPARADDYPNHTITMVVPFAAGGLSDVPARIMAAMLADRIHQTIVVENKPGGSGTVGGAFAVRAEPDGYTLFVNSIADAQNLYFLPVPYNAIDDFAMIGMIVEGPPLVLVVDAAQPYRTLADLIADARAHPNKINFATSGPATSPAMALAQLNSLAKTSIVAVPYRGAGEAARFVAASAVQATFTFYAQAKPLADSGKLRALAIASPQRIASWGEVPTMAELGYPNFDYGGFVGLAAPAKTPPAIVAFLNKALNDVVQSKAFKDRMAALGMSVPPAAQNTPQYLADYLRRETARQAPLAALTGIKLVKPEPGR
jgi:tripartite-type tricarboxylate transporter receptor subunit TctC